MKGKGHDYSAMLIWSAAVVTVVRYAAAFIASDVGQISGWLSEAITILMGLSGLGMGILDVFGGTYLFDGWRRKMPAQGQKWSSKFLVLTIFVLALIVAGIGILVPFTVSRVTHSSMADVLSGGWLTGWAVLVNLAPYLLIGGVSVGNQIVSVNSEKLPETFGKLSDDEKKLSGNFPNDWRKVLPYLSGAEIREIARSSTADIKAKYHLNNDKTALNWRRYAQTEASKMEQVHP